MYMCIIYIYIVRILIHLYIWRDDHHLNCKELDAIPLVEGAVGPGWYAWHHLARGMHCAMPQRH